METRGLCSVREIAHSQVIDKARGHYSRSATNFLAFSCLKYGVDGWQYILAHVQTATIPTILSSFCTVGENSYMWNERTAITGVIKSTLQWGMPWALPDIFCICNMVLNVVAGLVLSTEPANLVHHFRAWVSLWAWSKELDNTRVPFPGPHPCPRPFQRLRLGDMIAHYHFIESWGIWGTLPAGIGGVSRRLGLD